MIAPSQRARFLAVASAAGALCVAGVSSAYEYLWYCNGCSSSVGDTTVALQRNTNSFPLYSAQYNDLVSVDTEWNSSGAMSWAPVTLAGTQSDWAWQLGDGVWEAALVTRSSLGNANGRTYYSGGACFGGCNDIDEADMLIANDMTPGNPDESGWPDATNPNYVAQRMTIQHEWGHVLGLDHATTFSVMKPQNPRPYVGGSIWSHVTPYPDDRLGAANSYGQPSSFHNLVAQAQLWSSSWSQVANTMFAGTVTACPGQSFYFTFTVGNHGTYHDSFTARVYLAPCPTCYAPGPTGPTGGAGVFNWLSDVQPRSFYTWNVYYPLPTMAANTTYWLFHTVDIYNAVAEVREADNYVHHAMTFQRWSGC